MATGRAELLRAFAQQGEPGLAAMARLLGYEAREVPIEPPAPRGRRQAVPVSSPAPEREGILAPIPFYRAESIRFLTPDPPAAPAPADLIGAGGLGNREGGPPRPLALTSEPKLTPVLRPRLASSAPSRRVDVRALARRLGRCEVVEEIPVKPLEAWARRVVVVLDLSFRLYPVWRDQEDLLDLLERLLGRGVIHEVTFRGGLPEPWLDERGAHAELPVEPGVPVLALTDLGFLGGAADREPWERAGRRLANAGVARAALVLGEAERWQPRLARLWGALDVEQPKRLQAPKPALAPAVLRDRAEGLLSPLAFSTSLEPALLRAVRRLLPAADFDVATELDAWFHPEVDGGLAPQAGLALELRRRLQERFRALSDAVKRGAVDTLRAFRAGQGREVWLDEVSALAAGGGLPAGALRPDELTESRQTWNRIATTLESPAAAPRVKEALRSYTRSTLAARQPESIWDDSELRPVLARAWKAAWADETANPPLVPGMGPEDLEPSNAEPFRWQAWQVGATLQFTSAPLPAGSFVCEVESANGQAVLFAGGRPAPAHLLSEPLSLLPSPTLLLRTDRTAVTLRRETREYPDLAWANAGLGRDRFGLWASFRVGAVVQRMRWISPGRFWMGSPRKEEGRYGDEGPRHMEMVGTGFWLADTPCTQELWEEVMGKNPSQFPGTKRPVEQVSWSNCKEFLGRVAEIVPGLEPRLPSERAWEYACRAGTEAATWVGGLGFTDVEQRNAPALDAIACYSGNSKGETQLVGSKAPNPWGLYDMLGNVFEWCEDEWRPDYDSKPQGTTQVIRGGSWFSLARDVRAAYRWNRPPSYVWDALGFRLARGQETAPGWGAVLQGARSAG